MNNLTKAEQDKFIKFLREMERIMREELLARRRNYFTAEKLCRELRRKVV